MISAAIAELKRSPIGSAGAFAGIASLFAAASVAPSVASGAADRATDFMFFMALAFALVVGFAFVGRLLINLSGLSGVAISACIWALACALVATLAVKFVHDVPDPYWWGYDDDKNFWVAVVVFIATIFVGVVGEAILKLGFDDIERRAEASGAGPEEADAAKLKARKAKNELISISLPAFPTVWVLLSFFGYVIAEGAYRLLN